MASRLAVLAASKWPVARQILACCSQQRLASLSALFSRASCRLSANIGSCTPVYFIARAGRVKPGQNNGYVNFTVRELATDCNLSNSASSVELYIIGGLPIACLR